MLLYDRMGGVLRCRLITGKSQSEERKTQFVPRNVVQGTMKGGMQQHSVKREKRAWKQAIT